MEVRQVSIAGQQGATPEPFPLVLQPQDPVTEEDLDSWLSSHSGHLQDLAREHGAVLLRGFSLSSDRDFDRFVTALGLANFPYEQSLSNAVRVNRTERVFTANEPPPEVKIYLHHEMAQTPVYPSHLFFFCERPADKGGATPICRSDRLWQQLVEAEPGFTSDCQQKGLRYSHTMPAKDDPDSGMGRSWKRTFRADSHEDVERRMTELDYQWTWNIDGSLKATTPVLPAAKEIQPGRWSFFNQLIAAYQGWSAEGIAPDESITYGDGSHLPAAAVQVAAEIAAELTFDIPWQTGDVALLDNVVCMHGRRTFQGERRILASLVQATTNGESVLTDRPVA